MHCCAEVTESSTNKQHLSHLISSSMLLSVIDAAVSYGVQPTRASLKISPASPRQRIARQLGCDDPGTCLHVAAGANPIMGHGQVEYQAPAARPVCVYYCTKQPRMVRTFLKVHTGPSGSVCLLLLECVYLYLQVKTCVFEFT